MKAWAVLAVLLLVAGAIIRRRFGLARVVAPVGAVADSVTDKVTDRVTGTVDSLTDHDVSDPGVTL